MDKKYWLTPPDIYQKLNEEFHFDFDPCPYPRPEDFNGITIPWGSMNYVNPPFRKSDGAFDAGPTAFARKAIAELEFGKSSVLLLPTVSYVNMLLEAGAEVRSMGRIKWVDAISGNTWKTPSCITCFIIKGK
jgi:hypothetical protein